MLDETEFAVPIDPSLSGPGGGNTSRVDMPGSDSTRLRQLAIAVVRLWAETFKGTHIFDLVRVIALSLEVYADLLEKPGDRTPSGKNGNGRRAGMSPVASWPDTSTSPELGQGTGILAPG